MTRKRHMLVVMLMAMAAIGIGGNSAFAAGTHQVPFKAHYSGTAALRALQPHSSLGQASLATWGAVQTKITSPCQVRAVAPEGLRISTSRR